MDTLPSVEECQEFMRAINEYRAIAGLDPLDKLDYDACTPCNSERCLSATHLFGPAGYDVGFNLASPNADEPSAALAAHLGADDYLAILIPRVIKRVTDPFDSQMYGLRGRLVEAGVVDP